MAKIRDDLQGSIMVGGKILMSGDAVPAGVKVDQQFLAPSRRRKDPKEASDEPVGDS